jgi:acyl CoA:acetate/3-ketoacid CoA transferase
VHESVPVDHRGVAAGVAAGEDAFLKITHHFQWQAAALDASLGFSGLDRASNSNNSKLFGSLDTTTQKSSISLTVSEVV